MNLKPEEWRSLSKLLDEALDLPVAERDAWLDARGDLPAHLRPILRDMLAQSREGVTLPPLPSYADADPDGDDTLAPDQLVGPYRLIRELGRGGMGAVWLAERSDGVLNRQVAVKLPHSSLPQRQLAERFARERNILAALVHAHIARLYDAGVTADGLPYLAMEYVEGQSLLDYCQQGRLELRPRLALFLQVLAAVQYAHGQLVVHRDLKPGNIFVTTEGQVRLLDFGIAKLLADNAAGDNQPTQLTQFASRALTPHYAAPEQILGQPIGTAADIYSLGVVVYQLLAGVLPYRPKRDSRGALEEAILDNEPVPPSQAAKGNPEAVGWAGHLKGDLDTIVRKALKKDPSQRYATAQAFADDLIRYLRGEAVLAQADSLGYRLGKFIRRYRWGVAATALVIVALGTGLGVALWQAQVARKEARTAQAVKDFMQSLFLANTAHQADPQKAREMTARELLDVGAERLEAGLADAPEAKVEMLETIFLLFNQLGLNGKATDFGQRWIAAAREVHGQDDLEVVKAMIYNAIVFRNQSTDHPAQRPLLEEAEAILDRRGDTNTFHRGGLLIISSTYWRDYDFPRALIQVQRGLALLRNTDEYDTALFLAAEMTALGGDYIAALDLARESIAATLAFNARVKLGKGHYTLLRAEHQAAGEAAWALNELGEAEEHFRQALILARGTYGGSSDVTVMIGGRFAEFLFLTERAREGNELLVEFSAVLASGSVVDASETAYEALGRAQYAAGQYPAALESQTKALALRVGIDASPRVAECLRRQTKTFLALHRNGEAAQALDRAVAMRIKSGLRNPAVEREEAELRAKLPTDR